MLDKSADNADSVNIGEVTTSHSDILYYDKPNLPGTEFKIPHHVVTTCPEDYIGEKESSHSDIGIEREDEDMPSAQAKNVCQIKATTQIM